MKKREEWIDILKGIAMILVVLGHAYGCPPMAVMWVSSFHIAMFLFLSGITLNVNMPFGLYLKKKIKSLIKSYFIYSVVYVIMKTLINGNQFNVVSMGKQLVLNVLQVPGQCDYALWFLLALFFAELVLYPIIKFTTNNVCAVLVIVCSVIEMLYIRFIGHQLVLDAQCWLTAASFVGAGYLFKINKSFIFDKFETIGKLKNLIVIAILWILNIVCAFANWKISGTGADIATLHMGNYFLYYGAALSAILGCILLVKMLGWKLSILQLIGRNSLVMYCTHYYFLWIMQKVLFRGSMSNIKIYMCVLVAAAVACVGSLIVALVVSKVKDKMRGNA